MMNKAGYDSFDEVLEKGTIALTPERFEELVENQEALMLDTRDEQDFAKEHIPNSIFIGIDGSFAPWVGALITDIKQEIVIIAPEGREEEVVTRLARVGYDNTLGYLEGGIEAWKAAGKETDNITSITADELAKRLENGLDGTVMDVRKPTEYLSQHVVEATNFPLDYVNNNMNKLDREQTYYLHCLGGYRSMIMASILQARGFRNLVDIQKGWRAIEESAVPKTEHVCPTSMTQEVIDKAVEAVI
jgi:rhodanese-related sulfurtransferase